ncbi:MAG: hypothetical protein KF799_13360 [Bdellovibrionales bacterium]|nr:hypothetical protein [Bdellovibrionales bacterium]
MYKLIFSAALFFSFSTFAHEGHDHGPSALPVQKGGILRSLETVHLELVYKDKTLQIFPFEKEPVSPGKLAAAPLSRFPATATIEFPRQKAQPLELKTAGDHWEAAVDPKGAHRFTVVLTIHQGGHKDAVKWTVEPKK